MGPGIGGIAAFAALILLPKVQFVLLYFHFIHVVSFDPAGRDASELKQLDQKIESNLHPSLTTGVEARLYIQSEYLFKGLLR